MQCLRRPALIGFFIPIAEALAAGYIAVVVAYLLLMLLVTRLGRKVLMDGDCVSNTYTILLCFVWCAAATAGAYICGGISPLPPWGPVLFPVTIAIVSGSVVLRNARQLPNQQSLSATASIFVMILAGTIGGLYLRHAFVALKAA